jgi:uncharacterized membrane protein YhaH (DUF805 family)
MESTSPYSPPQTELVGDQEEYGQIKIFTSKGRIGRLRYIAYTIGVSLLWYLAIIMLLGLVSMTLTEQQAGPFLIAISYLGVGGMLLINVLLTIQRSHDFNVTGLLSMVLLIPLVPIIFWIIPGTQGANRFGPPPPPNNGVGVVVIVLLLLIFILGILAAIAIPAYEEYMAQAAAGL